MVENASHEKPVSGQNLLRCRWCPWTTMRFRGKQTFDRRGMSYGERQLRAHVIEYHEDEYLLAQGLVACDLIYTCWTLDENTDGQRSL